MDTIHFLCAFIHFVSQSFFSLLLASSCTKTDFIWFLLKKKLWACTHTFGQELKVVRIIFLFLFSILPILDCCCVASGQTSQRKEKWMNWIRNNYTYTQPIYYSVRMRSHISQCIKVKIQLVYFYWYIISFFIFLLHCITKLMDNHCDGDAIRAPRQLDNKNINWSLCARAHFHLWFWNFCTIQPIEFIWFVVFVHTNWQYN